MVKYQTLNPEYGYNLAEVHPDGRISHSEDFRRKVSERITLWHQANSTLTWAIVKAIRDTYRAGNHTFKEISQLYKQNLPKVASALRNHSWHDPQYVYKKKFQGHTMSTDELTKIEFLMSQGFSARRIANEVSLNRNNISEYLRIKGYTGTISMSMNTIILNAITGIYYLSIKEAASAHNLKPGLLYQYLTGKFPNKTDLILANG